MSKARSFSMEQIGGFSSRPESPSFVPAGRRSFAADNKQLTSPLIRSQSEDNASRRLERMLEGGHVLGTGFGAVVPKNYAHAGRERNEVWNLSTVMVVLASAVTVPLVTVIQVNKARKSHENIFRDDLTEAYVRFASIPVACAAVNWFVQHMRQTCFWWEKKDKSGSERSSCIDPLSLALMAIATLVLLRESATHAFTEYAADAARYYLSVVIGGIGLRLWFALLDALDGIIHVMVLDQQEINRCRPVKKMQNIVEKISRTGQPEKDIVYSFASANTVPAKVLSYIWWLYYLTANIFGVVIFLAILFQDEQTVSRFILGWLVVSSAASCSLIFELGPNSISLLRLSLYKPFYVGDLITLNPSGALGSPATSIMGFVENITMMYVVIRNFEMKQTWVSHDIFNKMIIQNWTRRPTKTVLLNIGMSTRCPLARVQQLTDFAKKWITKSPEIQQENYKKFHITKTGNGYNLEIIFFPLIGVSHRAIRQKFLLAFMAAAERLKVPFVPLDLMNNFCEAPAASEEWPAEDTQQASFPSPDTPRGQKREPQGTPKGPDEFADLWPDPRDIVLKDE